MNKKDWTNWLIALIVALSIAVGYTIVGAGGLSCNQLIEARRLAAEAEDFDLADEFKDEWDRYCGPDKRWYSLKRQTHNEPLP